MPILPEFNLPSENDLKPFWITIQNYAKASEAEREKYAELQKEMHYNEAALHPELLSLSKACRIAYEAMDDTRKAVESRFPDLHLSCPAPWVGFSEDPENYQKSLQFALKDYLDRRWYEANREEIEELRKSLKGTPPCSNFCTGMIVFNRKNDGLFRVGKITHNGKRVNAESLVTQEKAVFRPYEADQFYPIEPKIAEKMIALYQSRKENRNRVV